MMLVFLMFGYFPALPSESVEYTPTRVTQSIFVLDERHTVRVVDINDLPDKRWQQPGGLLGVKGWTSRKYKYVPTKLDVHSFGDIQVFNGTNLQTNKGIVRNYPVGTRFDELLINANNKVFEHRVREKAADGWKSTVYFKDEEARPPGYVGLKVSCSSCHKEAGTGNYGVGLVPGGDTVLSDPLNWGILK